MSQELFGRPRIALPGYLGGITAQSEMPVAANDHCSQPPAFRDLAECWSDASDEGKRIMFVVARAIANAEREDR